MRFVLSVIVNALALAVAVFFLPGVYIAPANGSNSDGAMVLAYLGAGLIFGVVNASLGKIVRIISIPMYCLTLGLFALVVNALLFKFTAWLSNLTGLITFTIDEFFWTAILGALIVSIVSAILGLLTRSMTAGAVR